MSVVTVAQVKEAIPGIAWSDDTIQMSIDAAEASLDQIVGPLGSDSRVFVGGVPILFLPRPAATILSVVEHGDPDVTLAADDYEVWRRGRELRRVNSGTNPADVWARTVDVAFQPQEEVVQRAVTIIELVRIDNTYSGGVTSRTMGSWSETTSSSAVDRQKEREGAIRRYITAANGGMVFA